MPPSMVPTRATWPVRAPRKREISSTATTRAAHRYRQLFEGVDQIGVGAQQLELLRFNARKAGCHAAHVDGHDAAQQNQPQHDGKALNDVSDRVGK